MAGFGVTTEGLCTMMKDLLNAAAAHDGIVSYATCSSSSFVCSEPLKGMAWDPFPLCANKFTGFS
jgi:hypothetical protein